MQSNVLTSLCWFFEKLNFMQDKAGLFWTLALVHDFMKVKDENVK